MCQIELEILPVFGSEKRPDAEQRGSSGKRSRNLSKFFLKVGIGVLEIELKFAGRQFQRLLAVRAKEEDQGTSAGLW